MVRGRASASASGSMASSSSSSSAAGDSSGAPTDRAEKTRMRSPSYGAELIRSLNELKANDELCDFTVTAEGKSIQVHKILLAATSDYFRAMLQEPMKESKEAKVDLKGISSLALDQIIEFIYTGEMNFDLDNLIEILNAGSHLQIRTALDLCSDFMISLLTFANADDLLHIADMYSLNKVTEFYNNKVLHHFDEFSHTEQFLGLSASTLARYIADDDLRVRSESLLYDAVARWYAHDQSRRTEVLDDVVQHIRFCLLSEPQLVQLSQHWLTRQCSGNMKYITAGVEYHRLAAVGYPLGPTQGNHQAKVRAPKHSLVLVHQGSSYRPFELSGYNEDEKKFYQLVVDISGSRDCRVAHLDNFVYLCRVVDCGGGTLMNSLLRFDPRHLALSELTPCRRLRIDAALVVRGKRYLYVFGGTSENFVLLDTVECYDCHTNTWVDDIAMPAPTHSHAGVESGELLYLSGGVSGQERKPTNILHAYNPTNHTYTVKEPMHCARRLHEMAVVGEKRVYVLGGIGGHSVHQQTQIPIESYNVTTNQWTVLTTTLAGRSVGHFLPYDGRILSIGREHHDATEDEIWQYNVDTDVWSAYAKMPRKNGPSAAAATLLAVNFYDEKICRNVISEKR